MVSLAGCLTITSFTRSKLASLTFTTYPLLMLLYKPLYNFLWNSVRAVKHTPNWAIKTGFIPILTALLTRVDICLEFPIGNYQEIRFFFLYFQSFSVKKINEGCVNAAEDKEISSWSTSNQGLTGFPVQPNQLRHSIMCESLSPQLIIAISLCRLH